jgi:cellulose synthase (UDP-forming)
MGYLNHDQNIVTRVASTFLMIYHRLIIPLNNSLNSAFFCGTGGAIKKDVLRKMGGWNEKSLTEDADLSFHIIKAGYKSLYLPNVVAKGELPFTLMSFIRQQMRWVYGMTRIFVENGRQMLFHKDFSLGQKVVMTYITMGSAIAPFVAVMTISGMLSMSTGTPKPISIYDAVDFAKNFALSGGFLLAAFIALNKEGKTYLFKSVFLGTITIGVLITITNTIAMTRALTGAKMVWFRTPKFGSLKIIEIFRELFRGVFGK